jgi:small-conductance mechanosensitive channel
MKLRQWIIGIVLVLLVASAIVGLVWTQNLGQPSQGTQTSAKSRGKKVAGATDLSSAEPLVDVSPLQMARRVAALAASSDEQRLSDQAQKIADHEVDLAFYDALRTAGRQTPPNTPEIQEIFARKKAGEAAVNTDQELITQLTKKLAQASDSQKENLQDQLDVAKAQLELDQYEVDDATEDLQRSGADPKAKIKRLQAEHEAGISGGPIPPSAQARAAEQNYQAHTLLSVFRAWRQLLQERMQIEEARQEAVAEVQNLSRQHGTLEKQNDEKKADRESAKQQAKGFSQSNQAASRAESKATAQAALDSLKRHSEDQKSLSDLDKRIQDEQELSDIYANWGVLVAARERAALHNTIETMLWILVVALVVYLANRLIDRVLAGVTAENKRMSTLQTVVKFAVQAVGAIVILLVIFGVPNETTTFLGLAGAGLTVALKDFIVAFFGWFVLMGRNGIRVGDWVEINGVSGEVVEVGLMRTVLLETGNWTDTGHPTGRRVAFVNGFAIEGHFFNFSTSGQWMWDELEVEIPAGQDPYPIIDGIQKLVEKETAANSKKAQEEWQHTTTRYKVQALSAVPGINVRPTGGGIEVNVRYITRAYERHETRARLYQEVVELMHGRREAVKE